MKKLLVCLLAVCLLLPGCAPAEELLLGADVSSLLSEEKSGCIYYDAAGRETDLLAWLKQSGANCVRLRCWVDPCDASGRTYGGGVCDADTVEALALRAAAEGLTVFLDLHYSDFWADPARRRAPKAWEGLPLNAKAEALRTWTRALLTRLKNAGAEVVLVQVGNEINGGLCGETAEEAVCTLLRAGSEAVREVLPKARVAVHFTDVQKEGTCLWAAEMLDRGQVDYDVLAVSWYPMWHGSIAHLQAALKQVRDQYGKQVLIAETASPWTLADGDGHPNSVSSAAGLPYAVSPAGQAQCWQDALACMEALGGAGVFWWEPGWVPVPAEDPAARASAWARYGSGWATEAAGTYDENAAQWHGGSAWDNMTLFDAAGRAFSEGFFAAGTDLAAP